MEEASVLVELPPSVLDTPLGRAIGRAHADSFHGRKLGEEILSTADHMTRVRIIYRPGQPADVTFVATRGES